MSIAFDPVFEDFATGHLRIDCADYPEQFAIMDCDIIEEMSENFLIVANVLVKNIEITAKDILDRYFFIELDVGDEPRFFGGYCSKVSFLDQSNSMNHLSIELRPKLWHLQHRVDTRVFVDYMPMDAVRHVFGEAGATDFEDQTKSSESDPAELIVQYSESDLNFILRWLEREGRYFYFKHEIDRNVMVLCDNRDSHDPVPGHEIIDFKEGNTVSRSAPDCVFDWDEHTLKQTTTFATTDYDFKKINANLFATADVLHPVSDEAESYTYPGGYTEISEGERLLGLKTGGTDAASHRVTARTNVLNFGIGHLFTLAGLDNDSDGEYLVVSTRIRLEGGPRDAVESGVCNPYTCSFQAMPSDRDFRARNKARQPLIPGIQTAEVVGPAGQEIYTDEYGRVKVQFHWDRLGQKDENSSCWIRVSTPWAGRNWGSICVPRIGQEVVVQFEEGNPDRPLITGMLFNAKNMPPNGLPGAASQMGMKSNSTLGGGGANSFMMEDKKGAERYDTVAERDYSLTVKNDAQIDIGYEVASPGSLTMNVCQDRIESVSNGDYNIGVDTGNRITYVKTDDTVTVDGNRSEIIKNTLGSEAKDITMNGKTSLKAESPDVTINGKTKTKIGSAAIEVDGTTIKIAGKAEITLSVGGSSIKLDPSGVTIAGPLVKIN